MTFRMATNIAAAAAAATAAVPGAAQLAGRRAVEVAPVVCTGKVASVYTDRKFGFILCPGAAGAPGAGGGAGGAVGSVAAGSDASSSSAPASETGATAGGSEAGATEDPAAGEEKAADGDAAPAPAAPATEEDKKEGTALSTAPSSESGVPPTDASDVSGITASGKPSAGAGAAAAANKPRRVFFHFSEVAGGLALRVGDEVAFILHSNLKNGELNAARVRRTKAAPDPPAKPAKPASASTAEPPAPAANPNKLRLTGNLASGDYKTQYKPAMPDGTKGFVFDRTKGLEAAAADMPEGRPFVFFAGLPLKGVGKVFAAALSVQARPFIPRAESMNKLNLAGST